MKGGVGLASVIHGDLIVSALAVVNAVGDIVDESGRMLAGARTPEGKWVGEMDPLRQLARSRVAPNTVLVAIMINAKLTKVEANRVAQRGHDGLARVVKPAHTSRDGDVVFCLSSGQVDAEFDLIAELGADVTAEAIRNGVRHATSVDGAKALRDL